MNWYHTKIFHYTVHTLTVFVRHQIVIYSLAVWLYLLICTYTTDINKITYDLVVVDMVESWYMATEKDNGIHC